MEKEEINRSYYAIIPANVRYDNELTPNAKLLYGEITALCNEKGYCWATNDYFAKLYYVSKTSISKWISSLSKNNYISTEIIYKEGTKEIEYRYIRIVSGGIEKKLNTGIEEKLKDNNTSNNTYNNISHSKAEDLNYDLSNFCNKYDIQIDTCSSLLAEMDFGLIAKAFEESEYLRTDNQCKFLSTIIKRYQKIIKGFYKDTTKPTKNNKDNWRGLDTLQKLYEMEDDE